MSKVNCYFDTKQKARHRMRRYETAHKKLSRARKSDRGEYSHFYGFCGAYPGAFFAADALRRVHLGP